MLLLRQLSLCVCVCVGLVGVIDLHLLLGFCGQWWVKVFTIICLCQASLWVEGTMNWASLFFGSFFSAYCVLLRWLSPSIFSGLHEGVATLRDMLDCTGGVQIIADSFGRNVIKPAGPAEEFRCQVQFLWLSFRFFVKLLVFLCLLVWQTSVRSVHVNTTEHVDVQNVVFKSRGPRFTIVLVDAHTTLTVLRDNMKLAACQEISLLCRNQLGIKQDQAATERLQFLEAEWGFEESGGMFGLQCPLASFE